VHVRHLAPSAPGATVVVTTKVVAVDGRKVTFEVACYEGEKLVGSGTHKRAIVPIPPEAA
jgi:predicted thioesterase